MYRLRIRAQDQARIGRQRRGVLQHTAQRQRAHMEKDAKADRLTETGKRTGIPIEEKDKNLVAYAVYHPRNEERLRDFFAAAEEAQTLLDRRKDRKSEQ